MPPLPRIAFALLPFGAIAWQLKLHIDASASVVNFFGYSTNLSNLLAATILVVAAYAAGIAIAFVAVGWRPFAVGDRRRRDVSTFA